MAAENQMSAAVLKIVDFAGGKHPFVGQYVQSFDPTIQPDGVVDLFCTPDKAKAKQYATAAEALEAWRAVAPNVPRRPDGLPNRPMTVFTVTVEPAERTELPNPRDKVS